MYITNIMKCDQFTNLWCGYDTNTMYEKKNVRKSLATNNAVLKNASELIR